MHVRGEKEIRVANDEGLQRRHGAERREEKIVDLSAVETWAQRQKSTWEAHGYIVEVFPITQGLSKNSLRFNIDDGKTVVSTTIVWDSGEWEVSVGRVTAEQPETSAYQPAQSTEDAIFKVEAELQRMGITP